MVSKSLDPLTGDRGFEFHGLTFVYAKCSSGARAARLAAASWSRTRRIFGTTSSPKVLIERSTMS